MIDRDGTDGQDRAGQEDVQDLEPSVDNSPLSERVIDAVSTATDTDPMVLDPLAEVVDVDALDALFGPKLDGTRRPGGSVTLEYCGRRVTTCPDGTVVIDKPSDD